MLRRPRPPSASLEEVAAVPEPMEVVAEAPPPPERTPIPTDNPKKVQLLERVKDALRALPVHFQSSTNIEGLEAGDLFSVNSVLSGTTEIQVVKTLNRLRSLWDPDGDWQDFEFVRSQQTFPDVRLLAHREVGPEVALGLELKGWYLLSREGQPSFRYTPTPSACSPFDQLVVIPWHLSNVLAGTPVVYEPYIEQAKYAAELRNYYWRYQRGAKSDTTINSPTGITPYPAPKAKVADIAVSDGPKNFGRVARVHGLMDEYTKHALTTRVAGIEAANWVRFFKIQAEAAASEDVARRLETMLREESTKLTEDDAARALEIIKELGQLLSSTT